MKLPRFRELEESTRFTFVRHGESEANKKREIQGHRNSPLSATGRDHARAAGQWLAPHDVGAVISSPLARSLDTAKIIAAICETPQPETMDELMELDTGIYSGRSLQDARNDDPDAFREFRLYSWDAVQGAETRESLATRAIAVWDRLVDLANDGTQHIVCVSHGGMLQWLIKATIATEDQRWMPVFGMSNCGISWLIAESTSIGVDAELPSGTGYFANWEQINFVPY